MIPLPMSSIFANIEVSIEDSLWVILNLEDIQIDWQDINKLIAKKTKNEAVALQPNQEQKAEIVRISKSPKHK